MAVAIYAGGYGFELAGSELTWILFWVKVEYIGIVSIPVLLLLFSLVYTEQNQWVSRRSVVLLFIIPILSLFLVWTNQWHMLFYSSTNIIQENGFALFAPTLGVGYWLNLSYAYVLLAVTVFLIIRAYFTTSFLYRRQLSILFAGILIPWIGDIGNIFILRNQTHLDIAPILFTLSGVVMAIGLFRYRFLDLMPVARSQLVDMTQDAWIVLDTDNRFIDLNTAAESILHQKRTLLIGTKINSVLPEEHPLMAYLGGSDERQSAIEIAIDEPLPCIYDVRFSVLIDWRQRPNGRLIVLHDITKQKKAERALRLLNSQLESAVQARTSEIQAEKEKVEAILHTVKNSRDQFITSISHELRTPITNLKLYLTLLTYTPLSNKGKQYHDILQMEVDRLEMLAQGVVDLARLDSKQTLDNVHPLSLNMSTRFVLDGFASIIQERQLQIQVKGQDEPLPTVYGEPLSVQQAIRELIKNAVAFSPERGVIRITLRQIEKDDRQWVTFSIANNGPEISGDEQKKIFERFYRGASIDLGTTPGLGIGLTLVQQIMELHGGYVSVTSEANHDTVLTLWFASELEEDAG
ncbi:MAG: PAS domain-containing sensor histidine kinase [Ardenticatenaceae bacterium]|nr:MAG: PAS domain-containing sensor histidine kinase [Ardenticatenaceae bacterium]